MLDNVKKVYFIGIGGISMSALATYLCSRGFIVSGSDAEQSPLTDNLQQKGITVYIGHRTQQICGSQLVVYTSAIAEDNCELRFAKENNIPLVKREELLGYIFSQYDQKIAVSGTHGKTTTCGLVYSALKALLLSPTAFIGGAIDKQGSFLDGKADYCIAEACEYKGGFLHLFPDVLAILNIDLDHVDFYSELIDMQQSFNAFAKNTERNGLVLYNGDEIPYYVLNGATARRVTFGYQKNNDYYVVNLKQQNARYKCDVYHHGFHLCKLDLQLYGSHNVLNALAAIAVVNELGLDVAAAINGINNFCGANRRFMFVDSPLCTVVEDYAHHPKEITALLGAVKQQQYGKVIAVFQPHTYTRTKRFWNDFVSCFYGVDKLLLLPVYAAREKPIKNVTSKKLSDAINAVSVTNCNYAKDFDDAYGQLRQIANKDDLILIIGAGDIYKLSEMLKNAKQ